MKICNKGNKGNVFEWNEDYEKHCIDIDKIVYFKNIDRRIEMTALDDGIERKHIFYGKISDLIRWLEKNNYRFVMIDRGVIINMDYIESYEKHEVKLCCGEIFGISRARREYVGKMVRRCMKGNNNEKY